MEQDWPFSEPRSAPVFTTKRVIYRGFPVLVVVHRPDGTWRFLDGLPVSKEDAALVSLEYIAGLDPTLREVADLPQGWRASRLAANQQWQREPL